MFGPVAGCSFSCRFSAELLSPFLPDGTACRPDRSAKFLSRPLPHPFTPFPRICLPMRKSSFFLETAKSIFVSSFLIVCLILLHLDSLLRCRFFFVCISTAFLPLPFPADTVGCAHILHPATHAPGLSFTHWPAGGVLPIQGPLPGSGHGISFSGCLAGVDVSAGTRWGHLLPSRPHRRCRQAGSSGTMYNLLPMTVF